MNFFRKSSVTSMVDSVGQLLQRGSALNAPAPPSALLAPPKPPPATEVGGLNKKNWMLDGFHLEKHCFLVIFGWFHLKIHGFLENLAEFQLKREFDGMVLVEFTWNFNWSFWWFLWISAEQSSFLGETSQEQMMFSSTITSRMWGFELQDMGFEWETKGIRCFTKDHFAYFTGRKCMSFWLQQHIFEILKPELWLWYQKLLHTYFISRELDLIAKGWICFTYVHMISQNVVGWTENMARTNAVFSSMQKPTTTTTTTTWISPSAKKNLWNR